MQEDTFLNPYRQAWQQDNEAMEKSLANISLQTLHDNIARLQQRRRRRTLWLTLSAAASLALLVGIGLHLMTPTAVEGGTTLVAQNKPLKEVATPTQDAAPIVPPIPTAATHTTLSHKKATTTLEATTTPALPDIAMTRPDSMTLPSTLSEPLPNLTTPNDTKEPTTHIIMTHRLVAMGPDNLSTNHTTVTETQQLVKIEEPLRNTFHEAIVEPLLALMTNNLSD